MKTKIDSIFFDTNVYINLLRSLEYEQKIEKFLQGGYLYTVNKIVLMELWAGARSALEESILREYEEEFPLIGMSDSNFIIAGQTLRKMTTEYKIEPKLRRRLTWDILIALSARENNAMLVTENKADFIRINKFIDFQFVTVD